jgi:hypothetical protein
MAWQELADSLYFAFEPISRTGWGWPVAILAAIAGTVGVAALMGEVLFRLER